MRLYLNSRLCDTKDGNRIAMTFQVNNIAELKDRQANYSNTIKLPMTQNNRSIIGTLDEISVVNRIPYEAVTAILEEGGIEIVPDGKAIITEAGNEYQVNVLSGNVNFFDAIKGKSIKDLDLSAYNHDWNVANAIASRTNDAGYIWGICDCGGLTNVDRIYHINKSIPSFYAHTIVDKIFSEAGYVKAGDFWDSDFFKKILIPMTDFSPRTFFSDSETVASDFPTGMFAKLAINVIGEDNIQNVTLTNVRLTLQEKITGTGLMILTSPDATIDQFGGVMLDLSVESNTSILSLFQGQYVTGWDGNRFWDMTLEATVTNNRDVPVSFSFEFGNVVGINPYFVNFFFLTELSKLAINQPIDAALSLPDIKQDEFIKIFMQMAALISQPDKYTNVLNFERFDKLTENINSAIDLSDKLDLKTKPSVEFTLGNYGQENVMRYDNDDGIADDFGSGKIFIDNVNLPKSTELFKVKFSGSESVSKLIDYTLLSINCLNENGELTEKPKERIVLINRLATVPDAITYSDGVNANQTATTDIPILYFSGGAYSLDFQYLIRTFYTTLERVLQDVKVVTADLMLNDKFIADLNHFIPVYLRKFGNYFYVNKISNYISGRSTKTELIRL